MKKIILLTISCLWVVPAFAQLETGQHMVGVRLGLGFQLNNAGISYSNNGGTVEWGTLGSDFALSYYYLASPYVGIGAEIARGDFEGGDLTNVGMNHEAADDTTFYNFMFSARFTANPQQRFRFYMPAGIGLVSATQDLKINYHNLHYQKKATDNSVGWFVGVGIGVGHWA